MQSELNFKHFEIYPTKIIPHKYGRRIPASSLQVVPDAYGFSMIDLTAKANSRGSPSLPKGVVFTNIWTIFSWTLLPMGVLKIPGAMVMTLILYLPKSLAIGKVIPRMAPLLAEQTVCPICPSQPAILATLMITPLSPLTYSWLTICLAACLATLKVPTTLIFKTLSIQSEETTTPFDETIIPAEMIPALLMTALIFPNFLTVNSNNLMTFSSLVTSVLKNSHPNSLARSPPIFSFKSAITTLAFWEANNLTVASPNPEAPPVTTATKLASIFILTKTLQYFIFRVDILQIPGFSHQFLNFIYFDKFYNDEVFDNLCNEIFFVISVFFQGYQIQEIKFWQIMNFVMGFGVLIKVVRQVLRTQFDCQMLVFSINVCCLALFATFSYILSNIFLYSP